MPWLRSTRLTASRSRLLALLTAGTLNHLPPPSRHAPDPPIAQSAPTPLPPRLPTGPYPAELGRSTCSPAANRPAATSLLVFVRLPTAGAVVAATRGGVPAQCERERETEISLAVMVYNLKRLLNLRIRAPNAKSDVRIPEHRFFITYEHPVS